MSLIKVVSFSTNCRGNVALPICNGMVLRWIISRGDRQQVDVKLISHGIENQLDFICWPILSWLLPTFSLTIQVLDLGPPCAMNVQFNFLRTAWCQKSWRKIHDGKHHYVCIDQSRSVNSHYSSLATQQFQVNDLFRQANGPDTCHVNTPLNYMDESQAC